MARRVILNDSMFSDMLREKMGERVWFRDYKKVLLRRAIKDRYPMSYLDPGRFMKYYPKKDKPGVTMAIPLRLLHELLE